MALKPLGLKPLGGVGKPPEVITETNKPMDARELKGKKVKYKDPRAYFPSNPSGVYKCSTHEIDQRTGGIVLMGWVDPIDGFERFVWARVTDIEIV
jgi:hypothetical protein